MKTKFLSIFLLFLLISSMLSYMSRKAVYGAGISVEGMEGAELQTKQKPQQDYWKTLISRDPKSLGLKEDKTLKKLLEQPHIK